MSLLFCIGYKIQELTRSIFVDMYGHVTTSTLPQGRSRCNMRQHRHMTFHRNVRRTGKQFSLMLKPTIYGNKINWIHSKHVFYFDNSNEAFCYFLKEFPSCVKLHKYDTLSITSLVSESRGLYLFEQWMQAVYARNKLKSKFENNIL